jgi:hypothetical protein
MTYKAETAGGGGGELATRIPPPQCHEEMQLRRCRSWRQTQLQCFGGAITPPPSPHPPQPLPTAAIMAIAIAATTTIITTTTTTAAG